MRRFSLISITFLGLALSFGLAACDGDDGNADAAGDSTDTNNGDGDGDNEGDGDDDGGCFNAPEECLRFVRCIGTLVPDQQSTVEGQFGEEGSCWCGTEAEAQDCYKTCVQQLNTAIKNNPTVSACHQNSCALEDLDPTQPYGPIVNGSCAEWNGKAQTPFQNPFGLPGGYCAPECGGIAKACPEHTQTSAQGTCYATVGDKSYCASRCYVDPTLIGGTQCQCGATCQPHGPADGEGNQRGICTFE